MTKLARVGAVDRWCIAWDDVQSSRQNNRRLGKVTKGTAGMRVGWNESREQKDDSSGNLLFEEVFYV